MNQIKHEKKSFMAVYQQRFTQQLFLVFSAGECQSVIQNGGNFVHQRFTRSEVPVFLCRHVEQRIFKKTEKRLPVGAVGERLQS